MGLFSRRHAEPTGSSPSPEPRGPEQTAAPADADTGEARQHCGPWDVASAPQRPSGRIDLGSLLLPAVDGMQLRLDRPDESGAVAAVVVVLGGSSLELRAFAAPRTAGIWEELRADIAAELTQVGGSYEVADGPHGRELVATVPLRTPDGEEVATTVRFLGADGPRWFLRGVLQGPAARDEAAAAPLRAVFDDVVVVRGHEARPPRELLELHLPGEVGPRAEDLPGAPDLPPGPTIAEVR